MLRALYHVRLPAGWRAPLKATYDALAPTGHVGVFPLSPAALVEGFTSCIDALFDWFDRKGIEAIGNPEVVFRTDSDELGTVVRWAFKADDNS